MKSIQEHRRTVADSRLQHAARAEFGKLGFEIDDIIKGSGDHKSDRNLARRMTNELLDDLRKPGSTRLSNKDGTPNEVPTDAMRWAAAVIAICDLQEDLDDSAPHSAAGQGAPLRDIDGKRIGVMLNATTLRSEQSIAAAIGANRDNSQGEFGLGEFIRGIAGIKAPEAVRNALSEGTNTAGGYAVPTMLLPGILAALVPASSMLKAGASIGMLKDQASQFTVAGINTLPTAAWRLESGAVASSDPAFRGITIIPRSLAFLFKVSRELLADAPNLEAALRIAIAGAFAKEIDRAGLRGSGTTPEIRGLLNTVGINAVTNGANGTALAGYANLISAMQAIKTADAPSPTAAIMHPRSEAKLAGLLDSTGQPLRKPPALEPWQLNTSSQIPVALTVGTSNDCSEIYVGDFTQFVFYMREGISIQMVTELYAATGEIGFICHTRLDVAALYPAAFAVVTGVRP